VTRPADDPLRLPLRGGRSVELFASGFSLPDGRVQRFTAYGELLHVCESARGLRLGTEHACYALPAGAFAEPGLMHDLAAALRARLAVLPGGAERLARSQALDARFAAAGRLRLTPALALVCVALQVVVWLDPLAFLEGEYYRGAASLAGEPWRLVTAQFLHASLSHLALNTLGLLVLGGLLERQIGALRSVLVVGAAAAGAMLGCLAAGYESVVGVSGVVAGEVGGLLALELRRPDLLPAPLRLRRPLLIGALVAELVLLSFLPNIAHGAHIGGFFAGALAALATAPRDVRAFAAAPRLRAAAAAVLALGLAAFVPFGVALADPGLAAARRGARMLESEAAPIARLNDDAWIIATSEAPTQEQLELALALSTRAVEATGRAEPNLLDTLAEVYFQLGRAPDALAVIDEAITLAPGVEYFEQQRLRFLGERAADDRPEAPEALPPGEAGPDAEPEFDPVPSEGPGLRV
jgi:membrane associated rhomboid family serine protease